MTAATVTPIASGPNHLPKDSGVVDLYARAIDTYWLQAAHRRVVAVTLDERSELSWTQLGLYLTSGLLTHGSHFGLSLDGTTIDVDVLVDWLQSLATSNERSIVDLRMAVGRGPSSLSRPTQNLTWNSFHSVVGQKWIWSLWAQLPSRVFNQGADLIMAVFDNDPAATLEWEDHLTLEKFGRSLASAAGWISPLDDNIGFIVGIERESALDQELAKLPHSSPQPTQADQASFGH